MIVKCESCEREALNIKKYVSILLIIFGFLKFLNLSVFGFLVLIFACYLYQAKELEEYFCTACIEDKLKEWKDELSKQEWYQTILNDKEFQKFVTFLKEKLMPSILYFIRSLIKVPWSKVFKELYMWHWYEAYTLFISAFKKAKTKEILPYPTTNSFTDPTPSESYYPNVVTFQTREEKKEELTNTIPLEHNVVTFQPKTTKEISLQKNIPPQTEENILVERHINNIATLEKVEPMLVQPIETIQELSKEISQSSLSFSVYGLDRPTRIDTVNRFANYALRSCNQVRYNGYSNSQLRDLNISVYEYHQLNVSSIIQLKVESNEKKEKVVKVYGEINNGRLELLGYVPREYNMQVSKLLQSNDSTNLHAILNGGRYKYLDGTAVMTKETGDIFEIRINL